MVSEIWVPVASFTKEINPRLAKRPLVFNGRLANRALTSLVKEATVVPDSTKCVPQNQKPATRPAMVWQYMYPSSPKGWGVKTIRTKPQQNAINGKMSYSTASFNPGVVRLDVRIIISLWNLTGAFPEVLPGLWTRFPSPDTNLAVSKLHDTTIRRLVWWRESMVLPDWRLILRSPGGCCRPPPGTETETESQKQQMS